MAVYGNNIDINVIGNAISQLQAIQSRVSIILCTFENPSLYEMLT